MKNANEINAPMIIKGKLYVVTDSGMNGSVKMQSLVGPNGGSYFLMTYASGRRELLNKNMQTVWSAR